QRAFTRRCHGISISFGMSRSHRLRIEAHGSSFCVENCRTSDWIPAFMSVSQPFPAIGMRPPSYPLARAPSTGGGKSVNGQEFGGAGEHRLTECRLRMPLTITHSLVPLA